jgi:hypothetical protein
MMSMFNEKRTKERERELRDIRTVRRSDAENAQKGSAFILEERLGVKEGAQHTQHTPRSPECPIVQVIHIATSLS